MERRKKETGTDKKEEKKGEIEAEFELFTSAKLCWQRCMHRQLIAIYRNYIERVNVRVKCCWLLQITLPADR